MSEEAGALGAYLAKQVCYGAAGKTVGLDFVLLRQTKHTWGPYPVAADYAFHHAFIGEPICSRVRAVSHSERMDEG